MDSLLIENTKIAAYFLWEYTGYDDPLNHWRCAEDLASSLERYGIVSTMSLKGILNMDRENIMYVELVRKVAYMVHIYTEEEDAVKNWYIAERLLFNDEWSDAIMAMAARYFAQKDDPDFIMSLKSDGARARYKTT